jgi:hypothetical protein
MGGLARALRLTWADPRMLARFDGAAAQWRVSGGKHGVALGRSARELVLRAETTLTGRLFGR